jgi:hypothetical protein
MCVCHAFVPSLLWLLSYDCLIDPTLPTTLGRYLLRFVAPTCSCDIRSAFTFRQCLSLLHPLPLVLLRHALAYAALSPLPLAALQGYVLCRVYCSEVIIMSALCLRPPPSHTVSAQACCVGLMAIAPPSHPESKRRAVLSRLLHKRQLFTITAEVKHWLCCLSYVYILGMHRVTYHCLYVMQLFHKPWRSFMMC